MRPFLFTLVAIVSVAAQAQEAPQSPAPPRTAMESAFDPQSASWKIEWPGRVAKHDLVYLSPPADPMQGVPLGNGDVGVLCWCEDSRLVFAVNKCDLWDDAPFGRFHNWKAEEEEFSTTLRHAGRLIIDFHVPLFNVMYLNDFEGRLSLADATMTLKAQSPLGGVSVRAFVEDATGVFRCEVESALTDAAPPRITIERYGSRTFSHWYSLVNRDPSIGLAGTEATADETGAYLTHKLTSGAFTMGCTIRNAQRGATYTREGSHTCAIAPAEASDKPFQILLAVTPPLAEDPLQAAKKVLASARERCWPAAHAAHASAWHKFWCTSLMESGDDYLDNLWHLTMYYANASQRGAYPGRFINGLWNWNRDTQNWNFYFHWNQQQVYWPLNAAGHHALVDSYLKYRFDALAYGQEDAREAFNVDGAVVSDVCERRGYNSASEFANHTPVAQIAMEFWRQYRYTGDPEFLKTRALPYLIEAAKFFESLLERGEDGLFHAKGGTGYEGWIQLHDGITELVYARVLFATSIRALAEANVTEPRAAKWQDLLDHMAPLPTVEAGADLIANVDGAWKVQRALFKGTNVPSNELFAAGFGINEKRLLTSFSPADPPPGTALDPFELVQAIENNRTPYSGIREDMKCYDGIFPWVEFSPVFPSGLVGLADKASADPEASRRFRAAVNTAKAFGVAGVGWDPLPIVLARLGLAEELDQVLAIWPARWQFYCNGFGHYGPRDLAKADAALRFRTNLVRDAAPPPAGQEQAKFSFPTWPFRHMGMEAMSVLACAMNEALLQSHDGVIRVAPAASPRDARFTLHATDGFIVSAELRQGQIRWICIQSKRGKTCKLQLPWPKAHVFAQGAQVASLEAPAENGACEFPTARDGIYIIVPDPEMAKAWHTTPCHYEANASAKSSGDGKASLGLARMF